jgi:iron-sulfur cluster repair protein YtfE (RIC family)
MTRNESRTLLLDQHRRLRELMTGALVAAAGFRAGDGTARELKVALDALRTTLEEHNRTEEDFLVPLFQEDVNAGGQRHAERMLYEHASEHAVFQVGLIGEDAEVAKRIGEIAQGLDAHMVAEEATFLNPVVLRESDRDARAGARPLRQDQPLPPPKR